MARKKHKGKGLQARELEIFVSSAPCKIVVKALPGKRLVAHGPKSAKFRIVKGKKVLTNGKAKR